MTNKCNAGVGAVPVNVIMIVLQIGPTYQTCIYFAEKLMVLRCYDHNLNTDRLFIRIAAPLAFSDLFVAVYTSGLELRKNDRCA